MTVGVMIEPAFFPLGSKDLVDQFFTAIGERLEGGDPGSRFEAVTVRLFRDELQPADAAEARNDLSVIAAELATISYGSGDLGEVFRTDKGKRFTDVLLNAVATVTDLHQPARLFELGHSSGLGQSSGTHDELG